ncbi:hypothetical protein RFI_24538, partial [Reticulomyxa filosa]
KKKKKKKKKKKGSWLMVERERELSARGGEQGGNIWECIKFTTIGRQPHIYEHLMREAQLLATSKDLDYTTIYTSWGYQGWKPFGNPRRKRVIDSVILDEGISNRIVNDIYEFMTSRQWYYDRGIPYRRGYLLYGEPGSGKSSFVTALAGHIGYDICVMSLASPGLTDDHLAVSLINVPEKSIILFEDVDCLFPSRKQAIDLSENMDLDTLHRAKKNTLKNIDGSGHIVPTTSSSSSSSTTTTTTTSAMGSASNYLTFSGFLNALDGVSAGEERIVFMTTNHVDRLDSALIRPGRVDVMESLRCLKDTSSPAHHPLPHFVKFLENKGVSMAELQEYFLLHKSDPQGAFADAKQWIDALLHSPRRQQSQQSSAHNTSTTTAAHQKPCSKIIFEFSCIIFFVYQLGL